MKESLLLLLVVMMFGCESKQLTGIYYFKGENEIFDFQNKKVTIYNLIDSTEVNYMFKNSEKEIELNSKNESFIIEFSATENGLRLKDRNSKLSKGLSEINLTSYSNDNPSQIFNTYWSTKMPNSDLNYLFCLIKNENVGYSYITSNNNSEEEEFYFDSKFHYDSYLMFDRFYIFQIQNGVFASQYLVIENITADSLILRAIDFDKKIAFKKHEFPIITCPVYLPGAVKIR